MNQYMNYKNYHNTILLLVVCFFFLLPIVVESSSIKIEGYKFVDEASGKVFPIKGVNYYPRPNTGKYDLNNIDLYSDEYQRIWERDVEEFKALGVNAIRLYAVDPSKNHGKFMCALSKAGIYVIVGLAASCKDCAITKASSPDCYPPALKTRGQMIINVFSKYPNTLGFSAGNEVNHVAPVGNPGVNAPCQKKFLADMRAYINKCQNMRKVPVGLEVADADRKLNAEYYNCRTDPKNVLENAEWYGLNAYTHCDASVKTLKEAGGMIKLKSDFGVLKYSIPLLLTEYGCINPSFPTVDGYEAQRTWDDAEWMFSKDMKEIVAGGFAFEYSTENANSKADAPYPFTEYGAQNYGLGYFSPESCDDIDTKCKYERMPNFNNLATKYKNVPSLTESLSLAEGRSEVSTCPSKIKKLSDFTWLADTKEDLKCSTNNDFVCGVDNGENKEGFTPDSSSHSCLMNINLSIFICFILIQIIHL